MQRTDIEDIYRLSPLQQGMLFHELAQPESGLYVLHRGYEITGALSVGLLREAWQAVVARHPPLRTSFQWKSVDTPVQVVHRSVDLPLVAEDWSGLPAAEVTRRMEALDERQQQPFDLEKGPLVRLSLVRLDDDLHYFTWTFHHIIMEGWSSAIVLDEVLKYYTASARNEEIDLPVRRPFRDYLAWMGKQDVGAAQRFWTNELAGFSVPTALLPPAVLERSDGATEWQHQEVHEQLSATVTRALNDFARANQITLNTVVQGAWALLLGRHTQRDDVLFGATVSGRSGDLAGVEDIVGLFINTIPARIRIRRDQLLSEWLVGIQADQVRARAYEWCSLVDIHGWSDVPRSAPLFESIVVFSNWLGSSTDEWGSGLRIRATRAAEGGTGYPLTLMVAPGPMLGLSLSFDGQTLDPSDGTRFLGHLRALLENVASNPDVTVGATSMLPPEDRAVILGRNDTKVDLPMDVATCGHFEDRVDEHPSRRAVTFREVSVTYGELDVRVNRLAHLLLSRGIGAGDVVAVFLDRSIEVLVALLAVMKSGAAYVPIDPDLPDERIGYMLDDAGVRLVLTEADLAQSLTAPESVSVMEVDTCSEDIDAQPGTRPSVERNPDSLAYIIYTSGSTGRPKGVAIEHRSLSNFLLSMRERPGFGAEDCLLAVTTVSFDISGLELFLPLVSGGSVVIAEAEVLADGRSLSDAMRQHSITVLQATPAAWRLLLDSDWTGMPGLKALCGGEPLPLDLADRLAPRCGSLWNMYGPTETTIWSTVARVAEGETAVAIGRPIANTEVYVLDGQMALVPDTVRGQLYIGGAGVARGYLNRPDLTTERFVSDPFSDSPEARLYWTGDIARWHPDGDLECFGRSDHQLKIRGFRIEPGEIEAVLSEDLPVSEAVVVARSFGPADIRLVAYAVTDSGIELMPSEARSILRKRLPDYMIPNIFMFLDRLPLNTSGKVDRNALPDPTAFQSRPEVGRPPETEVEKAVAEVWRDVLGVEHVGAEDNFFDLGGHSLLAMQVTVKVEKQFGRRVNPMKLAFLNLTQFAIECAPADGGGVRA